MIMNSFTIAVYAIDTARYKFKTVRRLPRRPRPPIHHHCLPPAEQDRVALSRFLVLQIANSTPLPSPQHTLGQNRLPSYETSLLTRVANSYQLINMNLRQRATAFSHSDFSS